METKQSVTTTTKQTTSFKEVFAPVVNSKFDQQFSENVAETSVQLEKPLYERYDTQGLAFMPPLTKTSLKTTVAPSSNQNFGFLSTGLRALQKASVKTKVEPALQIFQPKISTKKQVQTKPSNLSQLFARLSKQQQNSKIEKKPEQLIPLFDTWAYQFQQQRTFYQARLDIVNLSLSTIDTLPSEIRQVEQTRLQTLQTNLQTIVQNLDQRRVAIEQELAEIQRNMEQSYETLQAAVNDLKTNVENQTNDVLTKIDGMTDIQEIKRLVQTVLDTQKSKVSTLEQALFDRLKNGEEFMKQKVQELAELKQNSDLEEKRIFEQSKQEAIAKIESEGTDVGKFWIKLLEKQVTADQVGFAVQSYQFVQELKKELQDNYEQQREEFQTRLQQSLDEKQQETVSFIQQLQQSKQRIQELENDLGFKRLDAQAQLDEIAKKEAETQVLNQRIQELEAKITSSDRLKQKILEANTFQEALTILETGSQSEVQIAAKLKEFETKTLQEAISLRALADAKQDLETKNAEIQVLKSQNVKFQQQLQELTQQLQKKVETEKSIDVALAEQQRLLQTEIDQVKAENGQLRQSYEELRKTAVSWKAAATLREKALKDYQKMENLLEESKQKIKTLEEQLQTEKQSFEQQMETMQKTNESLQAENARITKAQQDVKLEKLQLEERMRQMEVQTFLLQKEKTELISEKQNLIQLFEQNLQNIIQSLKTIDPTIEAQLKKLNEEGKLSNQKLLSFVVAQTTLLVQRTQTAETERNNLQTQLADLSTKNQNLENQLTKAKEIPSTLASNVSKIYGIPVEWNGTNFKTRNIEEVEWQKILDDKGLKWGPTIVSRLLEEFTKGDALVPGNEWTKENIDGSVFKDRFYRRLQDMLEEKANSWKDLFGEVARIAGQASSPMELRANMVSFFKLDQETNEQPGPKIEAELKAQLKL